jgi:hypothetical protein
MNVTILTREALALTGQDGRTPEPRDRLAARLLDAGGERVVWQEPEPYLDALLHRGDFLDCPVRRRRGRRNRCHANSARIWAGDSVKYRLVTGFALGGGCWRQHSWVLAGSVIHETTAVNEKYFGVVLTDEEALEVWWCEAMLRDSQRLVDVPLEVWDRYPGAGRALLGVLLNAARRSLSGDS